MRTSRIGVFHGPGQPICLQEVTVPPMREGELLVRNEYTTLVRLSGTLPSPVLTLVNCAIATVAGSLRLPATAPAVAAS